MIMKSTEKSMTGWYFLAAVVALYVAGFFLNSSVIISGLAFFTSIMVKIIPVLFTVFALMAATNYFVKPGTLVKYLGEGTGTKGWLISVAGGIISTGPIYMWYPLLSELQKHGVKNRYIAAFLYNRAVKIPLLPIFVYYFGLLYVAVLTAVMIVASVVHGVVVEKIMEVKNEDSNSINRKGRRL